MARPNYRQRERIRARLKAMAEPCAICGKPIDYDLDWWVDPKDGKRKRHPLSFEYDHIMPYSAAPDSLDVNTMANAQATHRICNQRKGGAVHAKNSRKGTKGANSGSNAGGLPVSHAW